MMRLQTYILIAVGLIGFLAYNTLFIVQQTQQAIVLQFGEPKRTVQQAGLNWKMPFIQNVIFMKIGFFPWYLKALNRLFFLTRNVWKSTYARYAIVDPLKFYQTVRTVRTAQERLEAMVDSSVRRVLGNQSLVEILSEQRNEIITTSVMR